MRLAEARKRDYHETERQRREVYETALRRQERYEREIDDEANRLEDAHAKHIAAPLADPVTRRLEAIEERERILSAPPHSQPMPTREEAQRRTDVFVTLRERERMVAEGLSVAEARKRVREHARERTREEMRRLPCGLPGAEVKS
jgi:hypothetical protein